VISARQREVVQKSASGNWNIQSKLVDFQGVPVDGSTKTNFALR
jgi:hypothetical protein